MERRITVKGIGHITAKPDLTKGLTQFKANRFA